MIILKKHLFYICNLLIFIGSVATSIVGYGLEIKLQDALVEQYDGQIDIAQITFMPQYEQSQSTKKAQAIEFFYSEVQDLDQSKDKIDWLRHFIAEEKAVNPNIKIEINVIGGFQSRIQHSKNAQSFIEKIRAKNSNIIFEEVPESFGLDEYAATNSKTSSRKPSGMINPRSFFTAARLIGIGGGTFLSIYYFEDITITKGLFLALLPALSSGALAYFSNHLGTFLDKGKWSRFLLESDHKVAKFMRKRMGLDGKSFAKILRKNEKMIRRNFPHLIKDYDLFSEVVMERTIEEFDKNSAKRKKLISLLLDGKNGKDGVAKSIEKQLRYGLIEVGYAGIALKLPQMIAGIGDSTLLGASTDVLRGAAVGTIAQGLLETALHTRRFQKVQELKDDILAGKKTFENQAKLLKDLDEVLIAKKAINHLAHHPELVKIENWLLMRSTVLSLVSVSAVGMEIAGIPAATPILWGLTGAGAAYFSKVEGYVDKAKETKFIKSLQHLYKTGKLPNPPYHMEYCSRKLLITNE